MALIKIENPTCETQIFRDHEKALAVVIIPSLSLDYFHVVTDEPGPTTNYYLLLAEQIKEKYNIDLKTS